MSREHNCRIILSKRAAGVIERETTLATDGRETGGILLGGEGEHAALVKHAGAPGPRAVRTPTSFLRDRQHAEAFAVACWNADRSVWVGEWHSHPTAEPVPSQTDLNTYSALLADDQLGFDFFISLIAAPTSHGIILTGWWCDPSGAHATAICIGDLAEHE